MKNIAEIFDVFFNGRPALKHGENEMLRRKIADMEYVREVDRQRIIYLKENRDEWRKRALACESRHR